MKQKYSIGDNVFLAELETNKCQSCSHEKEPTKNVSGPFIVTAIHIYKNNIQYSLGHGNFDISVTMMMRQLNQSQLFKSESLAKRALKKL